MRLQHKGERSLGDHMMMLIRTTMRKKTPASISWMVTMCTASALPVLTIGPQNRSWHSLHFTCEKRWGTERVSSQPQVTQLKSWGSNTGSLALELMLWSLCVQIVLGLHWGDESCLSCPPWGYSLEFNVRKKPSNVCTRWYWPETDSKAFEETVGA